MTKLTTIFVLAAFVLLVPFVAARADETPNGPPPVSQALVREGDFAITLAQELRLSSSDDEAQAQSALASAGVAPRGGWISDYPVTPVVLGQLRTSVVAAAESGRLSMAKSGAVDILMRVSSSVGVPVRTGDDSYADAPPAGTDPYQDESAIDDYYSNEGPPAISYYNPPSDYNYLYDWVPYPFWYSSFYFPGFFILSNFHFAVHDRFHHFRHFRHITNHRFDRNGHSFRVNAANLDRTRITNTRNDMRSNRFSRFNSQNVNSARSIMNRDSARFASRSRDAERGNAVGRMGTSNFNGGRGRAGTANNGSFTRGNMGSNRSFGGNGAFDRNAGGVRSFGGSRMSSSSGGGMNQGFRGSFGNGGGFSRGTSGGFGHTSGFSGSGRGGGFGHGGGFGGRGGGFGGHGGGFGGHGGGGHGGGGRR